MPVRLALVFKWGQNQTFNMAAESSVELVRPSLTVLLGRRKTESVKS
jgi:hypothetical protein